MKKTERRKLDILVLSDIHLGTYGCHAKELLQYLKTVEPEMVILNGDIIDMWQFSKRYWPQAHMKVIKKLVKYISEEVPVYYITGNHDEMLRKFTDFQMGEFMLTNKLLLDVNGKQTWIFHGDVFDVSMQYSKWLAKLGGKGYDILILINRMVNYFAEKLGRGRISLSKKVKDSVKKAVKFVSDYENIAAEIAIDNNYDTVICGHIHQPQDRIVTNEHGEVRYLNSGDWVENLTSLEYYDGEWHVYEYFKDPLMQEEEEEQETEVMAEDPLETIIGGMVMKEPAFSSLFSK